MDDDIIRQEKTHAIECPACKQATASKADFRSADATPGRRATSWDQAAACQDNPPHPRCGSCGILMGPGHIEASLDLYCGTCRDTRRASDPTDVGPTRQVYGRRGWQSDHTTKR